MVVANGHENRERIPTIDIGDLYNVSELNRSDPKIQEIAEKLKNAIHDYGFAFLVNHGIPQKTIKEAFEVSEEFFKLPTSVKLKHAKRTEVLKNFHGYVVPGQEALHDVKMYEVKELFDMMQQDRFYPDDDLPQFQSKMESVESVGRQLCVNLLKILAISLKLDDIDFFCKRAKNLIDPTISSLTALRSAYYPAIKDDEIKTDIPLIRCSEHSDWDIITLLWQDTMGGLEIKGSSGQWIHAEPIENAIVLNVGDLLQIWTRKYFPATIHRVIIPETEFKKRLPRQSMGFFVFPDDDVVVSPIVSEVVSKYIPQDGQEDPYMPTTAHENFVKRASKAYGVKTDA